MKPKDIGSCVSHALTGVLLMVLGIRTVEAVDLPGGYSPLAWIESTGHQLINTEWKASATLRCELDFAPLQTSGEVMLGTAKEGYRKYPYRFFNYPDGYIFDIGNGTDAGPIRVGQNEAMKLATDGTRYLLKFGIDDNGNAYADATNVGTGDVYAPTRTAASNAAPESEDVYVFGGYVAGRLVYEKMRLYGLKMFDIKDGDAAHSLARDFVPCRNEDGVAGLWEKVEGRFYANCVEGGLRFVGPDELPGRVEYIESTGAQLLNTCWKASATLRCELDFAPLQTSGNIMIGTGKGDLIRYPYRFFNHSDGYIFDLGTGGSYIRIGRKKNMKLATDGTRYLLKIGVDDNGNAYADATNVGTGEVFAPTRTEASNANPESEDVYVFGGNISGQLKYEKMRLYGLKMYDIKVGETERSLVRDFVPYRFANGTFGAYDLANDTPYPGTGVFEGSARYVYDFEDENDATLVVHEGVAPVDLFANRTLIAKDSPYEADFSAVTSYPALDLRKGTLSVQDDEATDYTVSGTMKVAGGTHLKIDLTAEGCDSFTATTLDFSTLSAAAPLFVIVSKPADLAELQQEYVIAEGAGVADGQLTTVVARGDVQAGFEMRQGKLVMIPVSDIPTRAVWTGGAAGGLTNAANWTCYNAFGDVLEDGLPTNRTKVVFPDGCAFDWPKGMAFAHGEIVLPASIGGTCDWTGLDIPIDTTIDLRGHKLYVSELKGTGTITDTTALGENLILDGSFEDVTIRAHSGGWGYLSEDVTSSHWQSSVPDRAGFTKGNTTWSGPVIGSQAAFIQGDDGLNDVTLQQAVMVPEDGSYLLTYSYAGRPVSGAKSQRLEVHVDDGPICGATDSGTSFAVNKVVLHLTAGEHTVKFVATTPYDIWATTILDDVSLRKIPTAGELHVVVPEGETMEWSTVTIDGALKFVKEGKGTYLASNKNGTGIKTWYLGDTWVREGCYKVHPSSSPVASGMNVEYAFYQVQQLGAQGSETTIENDATFDCGGNYNGFCYTIVLNGGTYANLSTINSKKDNGYPSCFRLTDDSFVGGLTNTQLGDTDLGGHTLTVTVASTASFYLRGPVKNGTFVSNGGRFWPYGGDWDMADVDLVLGDTMSCADQTVTFRNLTVTSTASDFGYGDNFFCVRGTYMPVSDQIHRFKLLDGAIIDLSARTTPLNIQPHDNGLFFDDNADTIYVSAVGRKLRSSEPLLTWTTKPCVTFKATGAHRFGVVATDVGLYPITGMAVIVR